MPSATSVWPIYHESTPGPVAIAVQMSSTSASTTASLGTENSYPISGRRVEGDQLGRDRLGLEHVGLARDRHAAGVAQRAGHGVGRVVHVGRALAAVGDQRRGLDRAQRLG